MIQVKIDTKEKFTVVEPLDAYIYDNMAADLAATCSKFLQEPVKNLILNLQKVNGIDTPVATQIATLQQQFYEQNASFVICCIQPAVEDIFEKEELLDFINFTPTESEAWDIVQMEEIERELLDSNDINFDIEE